MIYKIGTKYVVYHYFYYRENFKRKLKLRANYTLPTWSLPEKHFAYL